MKDEFKSSPNSDSSFTLKPSSLVAAAEATRSPGRLILETARLILREWTLADVDRFAEIYSDTEVMKFVGDRRPRTREETHARKLRSMTDYEEHGFGMWAVVRRADNRVIGRCGLQYLSNGEVEIGWLLEREAWGHGYALEAAKACVEYGFNVLKLPRIVAVAMPENTASVRLMEKLGMVKEGEGDYYGVRCVKYGVGAG